MEFGSETVTSAQFRAEQFRCCQGEECVNDTLHYPRQRPPDASPWLRSIDGHVEVKVSLIGEEGIVHVKNKSKKAETQTRILPP